MVSPSAADVRGHRGRGRLGVRREPAVAARGLVLDRVRAVVQQHVGPAVELDRLLGRTAVLVSHVRRVHERAAVLLQPERQRRGPAVGVGEAVHAHAADLERLTLHHGAEVDRRAEVLDGVERREVGVHLPFEDPLQHRRRLGVAVHHELVPRHEHGPEEREALDVVPVRVREQDRGPALPLAELAAHQHRAERHQARAHVDDDQGVLARLHRHARGVAAVAVGLRPRRRDRPAHAPERDAHQSSSPTVSSMPSYADSTSNGAPASLMRQVSRIRSCSSSLRAGAWW
jgi:hypothetical protein